MRWTGNRAELPSTGRLGIGGGGMTYSMGSSAPIVRAIRVGSSPVWRCRRAAPCCAAGPRAATLAGLPRLLHTSTRKGIAAGLALAAIAALAWRGWAWREEREGDRDED